MGRTVAKEKGQVPWVNLLMVCVAYTLLIFLVQVRIFAQLDWPYFRVNLMVPLCVEIASLISLGGAVAWAFAWGYVVDVFSGRFWGGQVGTYLFAVVLHHFVARHFDMGRLLYRVLVAGVLVVAQGMVLAAVALGPDQLVESLPVVLSRGFFSLLAAPLVMLPVRAIRGVDET